MTREQIYDQLYDSIYSEGYDQAMEDNTDLEMAYNKGLEDAWECAKRIYEMPAGEVIRIFGSVSAWVELTAQEAINRIKYHEDKQEAIRNLEMIRVAFVDPVTKEQRKLIDDTFDMAIKALEQDIDFDKQAEKVIEETVKSIWGKPPYTEVLDKIRAEIEKVVWEDVVVSLDGTDEVRIPRLDPDDVFEIIDKYRKGKNDNTDRE